MNKAQELEQTLYKLLPQNWQAMWYALGENFIVWDIAPLQKKNFTQNFILAVELLGIDIYKSVDFYCTPNWMSFNGFVRLTFNF